jgi:hypothetical protein
MRRTTMNAEVTVATVESPQRRRNALVERLTVDSIIVVLIGLAFTMLATHL